MAASRRICVAILVDTLHGGGAEKVCLRLARTMYQQSVDVHLIVVKKLVEYSVDEPFPIHFLLEDPTEKLYKRTVQNKAIEAIKRYIRKAGPFDLLLSNLDGAHPIASASGIANTWYVVHNSIDEKIRRARRMGPVKYFRQRGVYKHFEGKNLIAVSEGLKQELLEARYIKPGRVKCIYNPVDRAEILHRSGQTVPDIVRPYLLHVGRFARLKRHDVLFAAYRILRQQHRIPHKLVLLCEQSAKLQRLIEKSHLDPHVTVAGFQQNPYAWMQHAEALVLSSEAEGFGLVLAEAMICGTPVVSTDCRHGPSEILGEEFAEYLSPVGEAPALAANIKKALECKPDMRSAKIIKELDPENAARQYLELV